MYKQRGFNLVELMVVISIVAMLAAIAMSLYEDFVAKAHVAAALAEIRSGKTTMEAVAQDGRDGSLVNRDYIGLVNSSQCSSIWATLASDGVGEIGCAVIGSGKVSGLTIKLKRSSMGVWTCDASAFNLKYRPSGCG
ncbi:pilin [Xanthomonas translucens pv. undulosa]|uniref:pilin n=1 Tax=Xanthomonas campestris pv. translucens TaxID=343 RepID=UPI0009BCA963|nr:pilin [Xanthomonas translucens]QSQ42951.1 pilin [Xanthomonas translucens pv. translucens]QSQ49199.1 pilin [Xanthomonas translucens pv. undulosa]QSQ51601.1 pilin [Xanthomonas translucens pv. undulosa]QSQ59483.1 pilin [Xanthomonas translucens pv. undulosa]WLA03924.1 pilin [Xanthomonas translucens]